MAKKVFSQIPIDPNFNEMSQDGNIFFHSYAEEKSSKKSSKIIYL